MQNPIPRKWLYFFTISIVAIAFLLVLNIIVGTFGDRAPIHYYQETATHNSTFLDVQRKNPYCVFDPLCINPINDKGMANFQGIEPTMVVHKHTYKEFALPNLLLFLTLLLSIIALTARFVSIKPLRFTILLAVLLALVYESQRWNAVLFYPDSSLVTTALKLYGFQIVVILAGVLLYFRINKPPSVKI